MYGQFSTRFDGRKTKTGMVAIAKERHGNIHNAQKSDNNTLTYNDDRGVAYVMLHNTDILEFHPDGTTVVNTGGFNTKTTRERINEYGRGIVRCYTSKGVLHINGVPVKEIATVYKNGDVSSDISKESLTALTSKINAYMKEWKRKGLPSAEQSGGDPWIFDDSQVTQDVMMDWIESKYVFRLLLVLAFRFAGMSEHGIVLYFHDYDRKGGKLDAIATRRLRRYIRAKLGLES